MKRIAINLTLVVVSLGVVFGLAIFADKVVGVVNPPQEPPPEENGVIFYPGTAAAFDMHDYNTVERINSLGFRDNEVPLVSEHEYRIIAVGDSFTYGWGVNLEDTWAKQLEKNLQAQGIDAEVLNLGRPGAGPVEYVTITRRAVERLNPDMVLLGTLTADDLQQIGSLEMVKGTNFVEKYFPNMNRLFGEPNPVERQEMRGMIPIRPAEESRKSNIETAKGILRDMSPEVKENFEKIPEDVKEVWREGGLNPWMLLHSSGSPDYFLYILNEDELRKKVSDFAYCLDLVREAAEDGGAPIMMLGIPEGFLVNEEAYQNVQRIGFQVVPELMTTTVLDDMIGMGAEQAGVPYFTATDAFREQKDAKGLYLELDRHMAPPGNKLFADTVTPVVAEFIEENL